MANIVQNITEISKIIGCSEQFYKKQSNKTDPYYESTMYLVNNGVYINSEQGYLSDADYPHIDLPNFSSLLRPGELEGFHQFIVYSNYNNKFYLYVGRNDYAPRELETVNAENDRLSVDVISSDNYNALYSYTPGEDHWVTVAGYTWARDLVVTQYTESLPFKVVWTSKNMTITYKVSNMPTELLSFCTNQEDSDPINHIYFARFYSTDGTYLNNDIYIREDLAYTDLYYGARKLSDTLICKNYPDDPGYPNDKIYLQPRLNSGGTVYGYRVYFKHDNFVIPLATTDQLILVEEVEDNPSVLKMTMTINGETVQANVLCVDESGEFPSNIYETIYSQLETSLSEKFDRVLTWEYLGSTENELPDYSPLNTEISGSGTNNYNDLDNRPVINDKTVEGNHTGDYYNLEGYDIEDTTETNTEEV